MALHLHTQQRDGMGRQSPVHGVRACDQVRMFDDLPVNNWPGAGDTNPGLFPISFAFGGFLPRLERNRAVLSPRGAARLWRRALLALKHTFDFRTRLSIARKWQASARETIRDADAMAPDIPDNLTIIPHNGEVR